MKTVHSLQKRIVIPILVLLTLSLPACGTLEVGIERTSTPHRDALVAAKPENAPSVTEPTLTPTRVRTNTPISQVEIATGSSYQANDHSGSPSISGDGRYVVFLSGADNLVPGDVNGHTDVFVYDRQTHTTELITLAEGGVPANESSGSGGISTDGRWVVFTSMADNLVAGDTNNLSDVFVHDRQTKRTTLVSAVQSGTSGNGMSTEASISADGRWIVFQSDADDLVPEIDEHTGENLADTNETTDIFVYDRLGGSIRRVNLSADGEQSNRHSSSAGISADGRWVVFWSLADNLVPGAGQGIYLVDRATEAIQWIADGFAPTISPDGHWIGFLSSSSDLVPDEAIYAMLLERQTGELAAIGGYANEIHGWPSRAIGFSMDGEWLTFSSVFAFPDGSLAGDGSEWGQQVFLYNRKTEAFTLLSGTPDGLHGNNISASPSLSADGRWIAFQSLADNLVIGDNNGYMDVFVHDRETGVIELQSWAIEPPD